MIKVKNIQETPIQVGENSFTILIEPNEPDGFLVTCQALPGFVTQGDTVEDAYAMAEDAIRGYIESMGAHGESLTKLI